MRVSYLLLLALFLVLALVAAAEEEAKEAKPEQIAEKKEADGAAEKKEEKSPAEEAVGDKSPVASGGDQPTNQAKRKRKPRSLLQACKKEARRICGEGSAVAKCLTEKKDKIEDENCKVWVEAREVCLKDAEASGKCEKKQTPRACLRKLSPKDVSDTCATSDFFKAVQMYTRWRKRHEKKTAPPS